MRQLAVLAAGVVFLMAGSAAADTTDPLEQSRKVDEAIKQAWRDAPISKEFDEVAEKLSALRQKRDADEAPLRKRLEEMYRSDAYRAFENKRYELERLRNDKWHVERQAMIDAAKKIYEARHEELARQSAGALPTGRALGFDVLSFPRIDGSTSTHPLNVIIASRLLDIPYEWIYPEPTGSPWGNRAVVPFEYELRPMPGSYDPSWRNLEFNLAASRIIAKPPVNAPASQLRIAAMINSLLTASSTTHEAYVNLINGKIDLNINARGPSESESKLAQEKNVKIGLKPIAKDALVFLVHKDNPIRNLSLDHVRAIYREEIRTWKQAGVEAAWAMEGSDKAREIVPVRRERDSGSRELFDKLVVALPDLESGSRSSIRDYYADSMGGPYARITQEPRTLAYSVYYYEHFMALSPFTRTVAIDGVEPNAETIASGKYPLTTPVYAAYRASDPPDSPGMKLLAWLLSEEGQRVVKESGYVGK
jgi:phosphate transport system substrate-binding protein